MGGSPELPPGWNPETDSLQDLVRVMFDDNAAVAASSGKSGDAAYRGTANATTATLVRPLSPPTAPASRARWPRFGTLTGSHYPRLPYVTLGAAILLALSLGVGQIQAAARPTPRPTTAIAGSAQAPAGAPTRSPVAVPASPQATAAPQAPALVPEPVDIAFGSRANIGDGWRLAATRPYLCDVLMAVPALQQAGTRIVRVTLTLTNTSDAPQPASVWRLRAAADQTATELVMWPAERFRGVPDVTLAPHQSARFLVAIRLPLQPTRVQLIAERDAAARAQLTGLL